MCEAKASDVCTGLASKKYFEQPGFVEYLAYLQYWKRPEYAKFIS